MILTPLCFGIFSKFPLTIFTNWFTLIDGKAVKRLPNNIDDFLTPIALAYWVASDGSF
jgi:hypothetical protein